MIAYPPKKAAGPVPPWNVPAPMSAVLSNISSAVPPAELTGAAPPRTRPPEAENDPPTLMPSPSVPPITCPPSMLIVVPPELVIAWPNEISPEPVTEAGETTLSVVPLFSTTTGPLGPLIVLTPPLSMIVCTWLAPESVTRTNTVRPFIIFRGISAPR